MTAFGDRLAFERGPTWLGFAPFDSDIFKVSTPALLASRYMKQSKLQRLLLPGPRGKKWNENRPSIGSKFEIPVSFLILLRFFLPLPLQRMRVQHFAP